YPSVWTACPPVRVPLLLRACLHLCWQASTLTPRAERGDQVIVRVYVRVLGAVVPGVGAELRAHLNTAGAPGTRWAGRGDAHRRSMALDGSCRQGDGDLAQEPPGPSCRRGAVRCAEERASDPAPRRATRSTPSGVDL